MLTSGVPNVQNKTAIVTGAASGLGRAIAFRLARNGFSLGLIDVSVAELRAVAADLQSLGTAALALAVDVSQAEEVAEAVSTVGRQLGPLHTLVNCAGIAIHRPLVEMSLSEWDRIIATNLTGYFLCARESARAMIARQRGGRIINIASVHSCSPGIGLCAYDASKGGVLMLTRSLALELAAHDITVNAVGPGLILQTGMGSSAGEESARETVRSIPARRAGMPEDVAGYVAFLCTDEAAYITGTILYIDGGMLLTATT